jgi:hypothetical protein
MINGEPPWGTRQHAVAVALLFAMLSFSSCDEPCGNLCVVSDKPKAKPANPACLTDMYTDQYCANNCERCLRKVYGRFGATCFEVAWDANCAQHARTTCSPTCGTN